MNNLWSHYKHRKKRKRDGRTPQINNFSRQKSKTRQKVKAIIEANSVVAEAMIEEETVAEDEEKAAVVDEVGVLKKTLVTIRREQKLNPRTGKRQLQLEI